VVGSRRLRRSWVASHSDERTAAMLSAAAGVYFAIWSEVEIPGWYYGLASAAVAAVSTAAGVLSRRLVGR